MTKSFEAVTFAKGIQEALEEKLNELFPEQDLEFRRDNNGREGSGLFIPEFNQTDEFELGDELDPDSREDGVTYDDVVEIPGDPMKNEPETRLLPVEILETWYVLELTVLGPDPTNEWTAQDPAEARVRLYYGGDDIDDARELIRLMRGKNIEEVVGEAYGRIPNDQDSKLAFLKGVIEAVFNDPNVEYGSRNLLLGHYV